MMPTPDAVDPQATPSGITSDKDGDIGLDRADKRKFCEALATAFPRQRDVKRLLDAIDYPPERIPQIAEDAYETWTTVFEMIDQGIARKTHPYRRLLNAALSDFVTNRVFTDLAARHKLGLPRGDGAIAMAASRAANGDGSSGTASVSGPPVLSASAEPVSVAPTPSGEGFSDLLKGRIPDGLIAYLEGRLGPWNELTDFQKKVLRTCRAALSERSVALIYAVTNSGKTTLARVGMNMALSSDSSAIMLLPTKALVAQEESEWRGWAEVWNASDGRNISVYAASRDYPENDRPVSRGRYDVAVAIYEKLGVYLVSGRRPLSRAGIVVVDELQTLAEEGERAAKLEALLTMIKMLPKEDQPTLLGLSATLTNEATEALQSWLGANKEKIVVSNERPIPLDTYVVDQVSWKIQRDAHLLSMPGRKPDPPTQSRHSLGELRHRYERQIRGKVPSLSTGELAAVLVAHILENDRNRRIICFVPSRTAARELSTTVQRLLKKTMGTTLKGVSPWVAGRFAGESSAARDRENVLYEKLAHSDLPERDEIIRGLKEGVAPHSSAYAATLRRLLEAEFRDEDGLLRVLVATDTLAVGINLPADTVIATSISGYSGTPRKRRILPAADLDNKGGRAGRRGKTARERGEFYLLVPGERELQQVEGLTNQELSELSEIDGVFREFVTAKTRSVRVRSKFRDCMSISGLVLQVLCQDGYARTEERWHRRVQEILRGLLIAHEGDQELPTSEQVLEELIQRKLIGHRPGPGYDRADKLALTGIGAALGRSGLVLDASSDLERLARLSCEGAGIIDLFWNACRSRSIESVTEWLTLPPVAPRHHPSLKEAVINMAMAYCGPTVERRGWCAQLLASRGHPAPEHLVEQGDPVVSKDLRELLQRDAEDVSLGDVNALLRAIVAYEWSHGIPFGQIRARFSSAIHSDETQRNERPVALRLYYSDVEQLCEQLAGIIRAAADLSFTQDGFDHSGRMRMLAQEVEVGLPAWLAPVAKMRIPVLHRQRLAQLWNEEAPEQLSQLLDREPLRSHPGITNADREEAQHAIQRREEDEREQRNRVAQGWADQDIPNSAGQTFEDLAEELDAAASSAAYLDLLNEVISRLNVEVKPTETVRDFARSVWRVGDEEVSVKVPHERLSGEVVASVVQDTALIIVRDIAPGAVEALKRPTRARFVQPEHILSLLASLVQSRGDELSAEELIHSIQLIRVSSLHSDGWYLINPETVSAPPPFGGTLPSLTASSDTITGASDDELS
ncbi:DEAD/DEAH box helicase [Streptomyces prunicolor]|uniref:Effector-associated domain EAD1-containing protein n=1 Tax=Streptomyces prunicolor TaxID=67348 RepID=A0ABU4F3Q5_9ACTN|nr:DEAD/DEAH box helicase [Streptomyces prunicolor]MDV7215223.1 effector-associated domain EAD1-containing protein [Streptomyces prunicolor]